ncbi:response regulator [Croceitalea marina]|uniref:Response regulator n=1 Tax=Croceitalea marina TaxID=1775166 RepID=A0ABW5MRP7_9FLAO
MLKILIIDDDEITNFITTTNLTKMGYTNNLVVTNGQEGIDYLLANQCPELILLDLNMPVMDGWEFLEVKERLKICPDTPIIVTTSSGRPEDMEKTDSFNNILKYMVKPIDFEKVSTLLLELHKNKIC